MSDHRFYFRTITTQKEVNSQPDQEREAATDRRTRQNPGRIAGIDYGTVRVGVAITDPARTLASPHGQYARGGEEADARYFRRLAEDEAIALFVVGLPIHLSGDESQKSQEARAFARWLHETTGVPVPTLYSRTFLISVLAK